MRNVKDAVCIACIAAFYVILAIAGIGCPIRFLTGISCAGCGMTRAWLSAFRLDFAGAFLYHPLFWSVPLAVLMIIFRSKINDKLYKAAGIALIIMFAAVYIFRILNTEDTVVMFNIADGAIWKTIKFIVGRI